MTTGRINQVTILGPGDFPSPFLERSPPPAYTPPKR